MRKVAIAVGAFALFAVAPVSANGKVDHTACNQECQRYCHENSGGSKATTGLPKPEQIPRGSRRSKRYSVVCRCDGIIRSMSAFGPKQT